MKNLETHSCAQKWTGTGKQKHIFRFNRLNLGFCKIWKIYIPT